MDSHECFSCSNHYVEDLSDNNKDHKTTSVDDHNAYKGLVQFICLSTELFMNKAHRFILLESSTFIQLLLTAAQ